MVLSTHEKVDSSDGEEALLWLDHRWAGHDLHGLLVWFPNNLLRLLCRFTRPFQMESCICFSYLASPAAKTSTNRIHVRSIIPFCHVCPIYATIIHEQESFHMGG